jgi:outer membrane protein assembly factor BamB
MRVFCAVLFSLFLTNPTFGQATQFRGTQSSGIAEATDLPIEFDESKNLKWRCALPGPGSSSPIIVGDRVFVTCFTGYGVDSNAGPNDLVRHLVCTSLASGEIQWTTPFKTEATPDRYQGYIADHGYASSTPATDGERVFVFAGKSGVYAFDLEGKQLWRTSVGTDSAMNNWGSASSPVVFKRKVLVNASAESGKFYALNVEDGEVVWETNASAAYGSWATPVMAIGDDGRDEMIVNVPYEVWSLNPENGKLLWYSEATDRGPVNPTVVVKDKVVYALGSRGGQSAAIKLGGKGDISANIVWRSRVNSYVPSPIAHGEYLYVVNDQGIMTCLNAKSGEEVYQSRLNGVEGRSAVYASPLLADGKIYIPCRRGGVVVVAAGAEFKQLARNVFKEDSSLFNACAAVVDNTLLIRSDKYLYRLGK